MSEPQQQQQEQENERPDDEHPDDEGPDDERPDGEHPDDGCPGDDEHPDDGCPGDDEHPDDESPDDERPGDERLLELLNELLDRMSRVEAAALLGVSIRTVIRTSSDKRLTARMRDTLTLRLARDRDRDGDEDASHEPAPAGELAGRVTRLDARVQALEETVGADRGATPATVGAGPDGRAAPADEPRPAGPDRVALPPAAVSMTVRGMERPVIGREPVVKLRRPYPELVTLEAEEGEALVYGRAAPLIAEWRRVRAGHLDERRSRLEQATDWVRMCELELALIGEYGLTLPPDSYPWDRFQRRDALRRRELWLGYARAERRRAQWWYRLRRLLTLGMRRR